MFTGLLIALFAIVGAATIVGGGMVLLARRTDELEGTPDRPLLTEGEAAAALLERPITDVRVGDVVQNGGRDFIVEGVLHYDEDGHRWRSARLVDVDKELWLTVGLERGTQSLRLLEVDPEVEVSGYPSEKLIAGGNSYTQEARGTATVKTRGDVGALAAGGQDQLARCRFWRYGAAGQQSLVVEQWGGLYRVLRGEVTSGADLELIPGS